MILPGQCCSLFDIFFCLSGTQSITLTDNLHLMPPVVPESCNHSKSRGHISGCNMNSSIYIIHIPLKVKSRILKVILPLPRIHRYFCQTTKQEGQLKSELP